VGSVTLGTGKVALEGVRISGETVHFALPGLAPGGKPLSLEGVVRGDVIDGTAAVSWRATRISGQ
jgi:hypothetical protein